MGFAMILYLVAIPFYVCDDAEVYYYDYYAGIPYDGKCLTPWRAAAWIYLFAALFFVIESVMDLIWSSSRLIRDSRDRNAESPSQPSLLHQHSESGRDVYCAWFDRVPWDILAAFFFLVPSMFYL